MSKIHHMAGNKSAGKHVIFIHGLGGNFRTTWMGGGQDKVFWPQWLTDNGEDLCIWSVEYESNVTFFINDTMAFKDRAANISESLFIKKEINDGQIILIGHSMGGLIIKQLIRLAEDQKHIIRAADNLISRITGVGFIGTPHLGSDLSTMGNWLPVRLAMGLLKWSPSAATQYLYRNNPDLRELNAWFRDWERQTCVSSLSLGEGKKTGFKGWIVKPDSADAGLSTRLKMVDKDHRSICKPDDREDEVYEQIVHFVLEQKADPQTLWLRANAGKLNSGWTGYGKWTSLNGDGTYIIDEKIKFSDGSMKSGEKKGATEIIDSVRNRLAVARTSVRLVGLSGVGKTRFAQALFEAGTGHNPLSQNSVFYTDTAFSPTPTPSALMEKLISTDTRAILIIDNCAWDLHKTLTDQLSKGSGRVSLLTIEYDIREDIPSNTDIITMEASSQELITALIKINYPQIGLNSVDKIAGFSGGNARVAIALASAVGRDDDISRLKDTELFSRLFNQRHATDARLQKSAEVLSLIYSFRLEGEEGDSEELECLSRISGLSFEELHRDAKELKRRGLAQTRSIWMAILPHPVANWLAHRALENISTGKIAAQINPRMTPRMFSSLTRRLGFLSDSEEARSYVASLLAPGGVFELYISESALVKPSDYSHSFTLISNIAPIGPSETLSLLFRMAEKDVKFCTRDNPAFITITRLLRSLAYESKYFYDCASLLFLFALSEKEGEKTNSILSILSSLFFIHLSGTHATIDQRIKFINDHIENERRDITSSMIRNMLKSGRFTSLLGFDFGNNIRDYGYRPQSHEDYETWYCTVLDNLKKIIQARPDWQLDIVTLLTSSLRGLWMLKIDSVRQDLFDILKYHLNNKTSATIWNAASTALRYDSERLPDEALEKLKELEAAARPDTFERKIELFLFSNEHGFHGLNEKNEQGQTIKHGSEVASEAVIRLADQLLTEQKDLIDPIIKRCLTESGNAGRMEVFAEKIGSTIVDKKGFTEKVNEIINTYGVNRKTTPFMLGALKGISKTDKTLVNRLLDDYLRNPLTIDIFPTLQLSIPLDENATGRIIEHLHNDSIDASDYSRLQYSLCNDSINDKIIIEILTALQARKNGYECVLDVLDRRINYNSNTEYLPSEEIMNHSRQIINLLLRQEINPMVDYMSYHLKSLAERVFHNASDQEFTDLIETILFCHDYYGSYQFELHGILRIVVARKLYLLLSLLSPEAGKIDNNIFQAIHFIFYSNQLQANELDIYTVLAWGITDADMRFKCLAELLVPWILTDGKYSWSELSIAMLDKCNNVEAVLEEMVHNFGPKMLSEYGSATMEEQRPLLVELQSSERTKISLAANRLLAQFDIKISREKESERERFRKKDERFE